TRLRRLIGFVARVAEASLLGHARDVLIYSVFAAGKPTWRSSAERWSSKPWSGAPRSINSPRDATSSYQRRASASTEGTVSFSARGTFGWRPSGGETRSMLPPARMSLDRFPESGTTATYH